MIASNKLRNFQKFRAKTIVPIVGIGTTNPAYYKLHIVRSDAGQDAILMIENTANGANSLLSLQPGTSGSGYIWNNRWDSPTVFSGANGEKMRIDNATGNVGIGTTTPGAMLGIGTPGSSLGTLRLSGSTSGYVELRPNVAAGSVILTLPATADTLIGKATTDTLTNKTLNADSTGNVVTLPAKVWLPAAGCSNTTAGTIWDLPTSTPAVPACVTGTNTQKGVLHFADTSGGFSAQMTQYLPADWTSTGGVDVNIIWLTAATSGNAKWTVALVCTDVGATATDDPAFPTSGNGFNTGTTASPGTTLYAQTTTITGATLPTSCVTGTAQLLHIKLFRDGNDASDTLGATASFIGMNLTYRRAM